MRLPVGWFVGNSRDNTRSSGVSYESDKDPSNKVSNFKFMFIFSELFGSNAIKKIKNNKVFY